MDGLETYHRVFIVQGAILVSFWLQCCMFRDSVHKSCHHRHRSVIQTILLLLIFFVTFVLAMHFRSDGGTRLKMRSLIDLPFNGTNYPRSVLLHCFSLLLFSVRQCQIWFRCVACFHAVMQKEIPAVY